jgi:hypothetical protein
MLTILTLSYDQQTKTDQINRYRQTAANAVSGVTILAEQIERSLKEKFGVVNPYKAQG